MKALRQPTTETLGLGSVLEFFKNGKLPASSADLVDTVFGQPGKRGAMVISGANGIVGAGKMMQLGSRLEAFDVPPWIEKTAKQMLNTAIHQTYKVACGTDADYKQLRDELITSLGISGTVAVIALAGFLTTTVGLAAALVSVIATILVKRILGPALTAGHKTMCEELKAYQDSRLAMQKLHLDMMNPPADRQAGQ